MQLYASLFDGRLCEVTLLQSADGQLDQIRGCWSLCATHCACRTVGGVPYGPVHAPIPPDQGDERQYNSGAAPRDVLRAYFHQLNV